MRKDCDFECYACELAFLRSDVIHKKDNKQLERVRKYRKLSIKYNSILPYNFNKPQSRSKKKNKMFRIKYDKTSLLSINGSYYTQHTLGLEDVFKANSYVNLIERTRSSKIPKPGDRIRLTDKHGNYYHRAQIESTNGTDIMICETPQIPFVFKEKDGIFCSISGGGSYYLPASTLKYIGIEEASFTDWGSCGACANGNINFIAEVSVWEYTAPDPLYGEFTTKKWKKQYVQQDHSENRENEYLGEYIAWKNKEEFDEYVKWVKGTIFPGYWPNQLVLWGYQIQKNNLSKEDWCELNLPIKTYQKEDVKYQYDDQNHIVYIYTKDETY